MPDFFAAASDTRFPIPIPGYQMLGLLGQGASSQVFKARQISTGQFVAIKVAIDAFATPNTFAYSSAQQRLVQESRVLALLAHPHVVRLLDQGSSIGGQNFMVLEYLPGTTLRNYLRRHGALTLADTQALMAQLLDALAFLHQHSIVHRDLKPENIMVSSNGCALHLKIVDFGLAGDHREPALTHAGAGTPAYCAPEQLRGERYGLATDIYAWALIFLECLNAKPCVQGSTPSEVIAHQLNTCVVLPEAISALPLANLLQRTLQKDLRQRNGDAAALYAELVKLAAPLRATPSAQCIFSNPEKPVRPNPNAETIQSTLEHFPAIASTSQIKREHSILCIRLRVVPANNASVCLSLLNAIKHEQMLWCVNTVHAGLGERLGTLGEGAVFHFNHHTPAQNIQLAARVVIDLRTRLQRRSRLLEVQHGVRVTFCAALHQHPASGDRSYLNHAVNGALNLLNLAKPSEILSDETTQGLLVHCLRFAPWKPAKHGNTSRAIAFKLLGAVF